MALVRIQDGIMWPTNGYRLPINVSPQTLDATGEKIGFVGQLIWSDYGSHTIDTTGSSKFAWMGGTTAVFDDASSIMDIGIQGVNTSGPLAQPDGSFTVKARTVGGGADTTSPTLTTTNSWHTITPTTGTATIASGDLCAFVIDFNTRAGSDSVLVQVGTYQLGMARPLTLTYLAGAWLTSGTGLMPNCVVVASDGTLGWFVGSALFGVPVVLSTWIATTNPDERGMIFQVPFDCKVSALWCQIRTADAASDFTMYLTSSAESGRTTMAAGAATVVVDASQLNGTGTERVGLFPLPSEVSLTANTDYCVSVRATGTSNLRWGYQTLGDAAYRAFFPGGTTMRGVTANDGSDFSGSSTTTIYPVGVMISHVQDGTGGGGGSCRVIGG